MTHSFLEKLTSHPFVGILRGLPLDQVKQCAEACAKTGLTCIEIPLNTPNANHVLKALKIECQTLGITVGAGTVRTQSDLALALDSGAQFIVAPNTHSPVIQACVSKKIPCIPGALTPTEIQLAYTLGATAVKVFPIQAMGGVSYIQELRGPFRDIPLLACGGVNETNAAAYLQAGCNLLAFGGSVFKPEFMETGRWDLITDKINALFHAVQADVCK